MRGSVPAPASLAVPPRRTRRRTRTRTRRRRATASFSPRPRGEAAIWPCTAASTRANVSAARGLRRRWACLYPRACCGAAQAHRARNVAHRRRWQRTQHALPCSGRRVGRAHAPRCGHGPKSLVSWCAATVARARSGGFAGR
eukprot:scaffold17922_cov40-Phaeocystis_antarctica.AAC.2